MNITIHAAISPNAMQQVREQLAHIANLEREKARPIARMNRPHLVAARWSRMRLIRLFN